MSDWDHICISSQYPWGLTELQKFDNPWDTLVRGLQMLDSKHKWWISSGTALGFTRDSKFIPEDTDIDIGIELDWDQEIIEPLKIVKDFVPARRVFYRHHPMAAAFLDTRSRNEDGMCVIFDVYFYYRTKENPDCLINYTESGMWKYPKLPTKYYEVNGLSLPFMSPREEYLEKRYGPDWRTPKQDKGIFTRYH